MRGVGLRAGDALGLALLVVVAVGAGLYLARGGSLPVERSAVGSAGLVSWLRGEGLEARQAGFGPVETGSVGLRVLPILDTDTSRRFVRPEADDAFLRTGTERDISPWVLARKAELLPSLLIAPKWTRAMRHAGLADPSLRVTAAEAAQPLAQFALFNGALVRPDARLARFTAEGREGLLYAGQFFPRSLAPHCTPVIDTEWGPLLIACARGDALPVYALSDPDLMNNHGLALADNAGIAGAVVADLAGGQPVLVDTTDEVFTFKRPPPADRRSWRELARFLDWPFSIAWGGLAALTALLMWRSWARFGPPRRVFPDRLGASRAVSIQAKARLLRMAGNDPQLFQAHVGNRLRRIERRLFGHPGTGDPVARIVAHLKRRDPTLAAGFASAAAAATTAGPDAGAGQLALVLEEFEVQARRVVDGSR